METHVTVLPTELFHSLSQSTVADDPGRSHEQGRFVRFPHPRTGIPTLFLPFASTMSSSHPPRHSILEVQAISPPHARSWFIGDNVAADGKLVIMTAIDPAFLLIPVLKATLPNDGTAGVFRSVDELFEDANQRLYQSSIKEKDVAMHLSFEDINRLTMLDCSIKALDYICDSKDFGSDMTLYRYSPSKTLDYLRKRVERLSKPEVFEISRVNVRNAAKDGLMDTGNEQLLCSGQIKAACNVLSQYLPPDVTELLHASYDFTELNEHMDRIRVMDEANILANTSNIKKTKKDDTNGKKRKAEKGSHGVERLKKANITGMQKLSSFFTKK